MYRSQCIGHDVYRPQLVHIGHDVQCCSQGVVYGA